MQVVEFDGSARDGLGVPVDDPLNFVSRVIQCFVYEHEQDSVGSEAIVLELFGDLARDVAAAFDGCHDDPSGLTRQSIGAVRHEANIYLDLFVLIFALLNLFGVVHRYSLVVDAIKRFLNGRLGIVVIAL